MDDIREQTVRGEDLANSFHDPLTIFFGGGLKRLSFHSTDRAPHGILPLKHAYGTYREVYTLDDCFKFRAR